MGSAISIFMSAFLSATLLLSLQATSAAVFSEIAPRAAQSLLLDTAVAGDSIIVVGERGHVLKSIDRGRSWQQIKVPTRVMLTAVDFVDSEIGFAVGHEAVILRTEDGGSTWRIAHQAAEEKRPLLDVVVHDRQTITAVGAYGYYLESRDAGLSWSSRQLIPSNSRESVVEDERTDSIAEDFHLNHIAVADSGRWYMAAEAGNAYRSDDQGQTWRRLPSPYAGSFFGVLPLDADRLILFGMRGRMFYSENAGEVWQTIDTGTTAALTHALVLRDGSIVVTGHSGSILVTEQDQNRFELTQLAERMAISSAMEVAGGDLLLVGADGFRHWSSIKQ